MESNSKIQKRLWILLGLISVFLGWKFLQARFSTEDRLLRESVRESILRQFPQQAHVAAEKYGLQLNRSTKGINPRTPHVILVHGLDDPGHVWTNLMPILDSNGYAVWQFVYPDDQPIAESARFFYLEMLKLKKRSIQKVDIVAHSMGGLVSREMLTGIAANEENFGPRVERLIMVGTPNHGSELARFRMLAEIRDQTVEFFSGEADWLSWIIDGAGEAGIDLLPNSTFLNQLNLRPEPTDTKMTVIAGILSDIEKLRIDHLLSANTQNIADGLKEIVHRVGDGLVTVESAKLAGAELFLVEGNHLTIIRNITKSSERIPPAIPIILNLLSAEKQLHQD